MPEPNLPPLRLQLQGPDSGHRHVLHVGKIRESMPELPAVIRDRLVRELDLPLDFAFRFVSDPPLLDFFLKSVALKPLNVKVKLLHPVQLLDKDLENAEIPRSQSYNF
jgi:Asp-tRNA(Asn)/Glu-tRNA(Gln) amidotransferase B subunit